MIGNFTPEKLVELYALMGREIEAFTQHSDALSGMTAVATKAIPGADFASITRSVGDGFRTDAPTDDAALLADELQYDCGSGPCVDAAVKNGMYLSGDLSTDTRWPVFGPRAAADTGIHSVLSIRLVMDQADGFTASLNVYSRARDAFTDTAGHVATLLATHGGMAVSRLIWREKATNLERALSTSRQIGMATGILMGIYKLTDDEAFSLLRIASQGTHRKVHAIALDVIETGTLDLPDLDEEHRRRSLAEEAAYIDGGGHSLPA